MITVDALAKIGQSTYLSEVVSRFMKKERPVKRAMLLLGAGASIGMERRNQQT
jgi:hypothetical protein